MKGEGSLVHCADVISIETVEGADEDAWNNTTDDNALTLVPGANPVGSEEPIHVGNKCRRWLDYWLDLTNDINPHLNSQSKCKACNSIVKHHKKSEKVKLYLNN
jgi:hypothetical protein